MAGISVHGCNYVMNVMQGCDFCHLAPWDEWSSCDTSVFTGDWFLPGPLCPGTRHRTKQRCGFGDSQECFGECEVSDTMYEVTEVPTPSPTPVVVRSKMKILTKHSVNPFIV